MSSAESALDKIVSAINLELWFVYLTVHWIPKIPSNELKSTDIEEAYLSVVNYTGEEFYHLPDDAKIVEGPKLLERVKNIKADVKQLHSLYLEQRYTRSHWIFCGDYVLPYINGFVTALELLEEFEAYVTTPVREQIKALVQKMRLLRDVTEYTTKRSNNSDEVVDLMFHIRQMTDNAMIISYSCLVEELDEDMALEINEKVSHLLLKTKPTNPEVRQSYLRAFKSFCPSDSPWDDKLLLVSLVDFFLLDLTELMAPMNDQMENLRKEMILLKAILVDRPELRFEPTQYKHLLRSTDEVICKAGPIIYAEDIEEYDATTLLVLLKSIKDIRPHVLSMESLDDIHKTLYLEFGFVRSIIDWIPPTNPLRKDIQEAYISFMQYIEDEYYHLSTDCMVLEAPKLLERMKDLKADVKQLHALHLATVYERSCGIYQSDQVLEFVNDLLESIETLLKVEVHASARVRKQMEALEQKMRLLRDVTEYSTKRSNNSDEVVDLMIHIRWVMDNAMIIFCSCLVEEMDEEKALEINEKVSHLLLKTKPTNPEVRRSYLRAFKSFRLSDSPWDDKLLLVSLVNFFLLDLTELMAPMNDQMENLRKEMILLNVILVDRPELRFEPTQYKHLLKSIDEVIYKVGPILYAEAIEEDDLDTFLVLLRNIKDIRPYVLSLESLDDIGETIMLEHRFVTSFIDWIPSVPTVPLNNLLKDIHEAHDSINDYIKDEYNYLSKDATVVEAPKLLERVKALKADVKQLHTLHLETEYERSLWIYQSDQVLKFINNLLEIIECLMKFEGHASNCVRKQILTLEQKLRLLRDVTEYTTKRSNNSDEGVDLMYHIRWVTDNTMMISYSCLVEEMDEDMALEINEIVSQLLLKTKPINPEVRQSYLRAFKSFHPSASAWEDKLLLVSLVDFFLLNLTELMAPMNDQMENLQKEMILLKSILVDRPELRFEPTQYKHLLRSIDEVICKVGQIIYAEDVEEDDVAKLIVLLKSIKDIRPYVFSLESLDDILMKIYLEHGFERLTIVWIPQNNPLMKDIQEAYISFKQYIEDEYYHLSTDCKFLEAPKLLEKLKDLKADIKQIHTLHLATEYERSCWIYQSDQVLEFVDDLLEIIEYLLKFVGHTSTRVRKQMEALEQKMRLLRDVTEYTTKRSNNSDEVVDLMIHIRWVMDNAMIIFYSCLVEELDEDMALEIDEKVSHLLLKTKPINPEVRQSYIRAFKSLHPSDSPWDDKLLLLSVVDFFLLDLMELMAPMNDQMENLRKEMILLKAILADRPELRFEPIQYKHLLRSIEEVICKAGPIIYAEDIEEDAATLFMLLNCIKDIRPYVLSLESFTDIQKTIQLEQVFACLTINWIPSFPSSNLLLEAYDSISDYKKAEYNHLPKDCKVLEAPKLLERMKDLKADIKQLHALHLATEYERSGGIYQSDQVLEFVNDLLEGIVTLLKFEGHASTRVWKQMEALEQKLRLLRDVTEYTTKRSNNSDEVVDLMFHIRWVADNAMIISYSCLVEEMDEGMAHEINEKISHLLLKIKPIHPEVRQSYIRAFKTFHPSDSPWDDKLLLVRLVDFFLLNLTELMAPMNDQMKNLRKEIILLKAILADLPEIRFKPTQYKHLLSSIDEVICKLGLIIYEEDDATTLFVLLKSIKDIRPNILSESLDNIQKTLNLEKMFAFLTYQWLPSVPSNNLLSGRILHAHMLISTIMDRYKHQPINCKVIEESKVLEIAKDLKKDVKQLHALHLETEYKRSCWMYLSFQVLQFVNVLLENIECLLKLERYTNTRVRKQMETLEKKMRFLRDITEYTTKRSNNSDEVVDLMIHIRWVADNAMLIFYSCLVEEMDEGMELEINEKIYCLLLKTNLINPEVRQIYIRAFKTFHLSDSPWDDKLLFVRLVDYFLLDLMEIMAPMNDQMEKLREEMILLNAFLVDQPELRFDANKYKYLMRNADEVICKAGIIIFTCCAKDSEDNTNRDSDISLFDLVSDIKFIRANMMRINIYDFPSTDEMRSFDFLLENLEELLNHRTDLDTSLRDHFETVRLDLYYLRSFLDKIKEEHCNEHSRDLKDLWRLVILVTYRAEFFVDSIVTGEDHMSQFLEVAKEIELIKTERIKIYDKRVSEISNVGDVSRTFSHVSSQRTTPNITELVVGFEDEAKALVECLTVTPKPRDIVSIVGMPGLGKTTLARKVYNDSSVKRHFDVRAWICVSQMYQVKDLLLYLLDNIIELTDQINKKSEYELAELLNKKLLGRRYLIVLDDMWDTGAWDDLKRSFPDDKNQSRILITSRMHDVAKKLTSDANIHSLRLFHDDESWMLLEGKVFQKEKCPEELLEIGKQIAHNCKGLPLTVALAAGLLSGTGNDLYRWKQFAETLSSNIIKDPNNQCMAILELSYMHLPDHLKSCFLYLGAFPEDQDIPARTLTWLWISEGFVKRVNNTFAPWIYTRLTGCPLTLKMRLDAP